MLQGKKEFVEDYSYGTPFWQNRTPKSEPKVVAELKTNLKDVAQYYHAQAQRTKNPADYQEAAKWYRSFIKSFPDEPESAATNFLLADTLFESKQYLDAAQEYENTAYNYGTHDKAGRRRLRRRGRLRQGRRSGRPARPRRSCMPAASKARSSSRKASRSIPRVRRF